MTITEELEEVADETAESHRVEHLHYGRAVTVLLDGCRTMCGRTARVRDDSLVDLSEPSDGVLCPGCVEASVIGTGECPRCT